MQCNTATIEAGQGSQTAGGRGSTCTFGTSTGGWSGTGGAANSLYGGGGGGGYYGGGGGCDSFGGGGSSFCSSAYCINPTYSSASTAAYGTINILPLYPTSQPSGSPSSKPRRRPSLQPTGTPSMQPMAGNPSSQPSLQPLLKPTDRPTIKPSRQPSQQPIRKPSMQPIAGNPSSQPSLQPLLKPSNRPTIQPSIQPSQQPIRRPTMQPIGRTPSSQPSPQPTLKPSNRPTIQPSRRPSLQPIVRPSMQPIVERPSSQPSQQPLSKPTDRPTIHPSRQPSPQPIQYPSNQPLVRPTKKPSLQPFSSPTVQPILFPTSQPFSRPSTQPWRLPSEQPYIRPSQSPSLQPYFYPSHNPTAQPSRQPHLIPSKQPSVQPGKIPSLQPDLNPSKQPSIQPFHRPSFQPHHRPSVGPSSQPQDHPTNLPSRNPTLEPSAQPGIHPTKHPSIRPSSCPTTNPSLQPTTCPSDEPTAQPLLQPSDKPTIQSSNQPLGNPSQQPFIEPSMQPSRLPSNSPTSQPKIFPSLNPTGQPIEQPSNTPSTQPTELPTRIPTLQPYQLPSIKPSMDPSKQPQLLPSCSPSKSPSKQPSVQPIEEPSNQPRSLPSKIPTEVPSLHPGRQPTQQPTFLPSQLPSLQPMVAPSRQPHHFPTFQPAVTPTQQPHSQPSKHPTSQPTISPSHQQQDKPTRQPTNQPVSTPSLQPIFKPSLQPTQQPTKQPFNYPTRKPLQLSRLQRFIVIVPNSNIDKFNSAEKLSLVGKIKSKVPCMSNWTVDNASLNLTAVSLTPIHQTVRSNVISDINLYLMPGALSVGSPYVFHFACGTQSTAISVQINSPPRGGTFEVSPSVGFQLNTLFKMSAILWHDDDLPISFQFGYVSWQNSWNMLIRLASPVNWATSLLPIGSIARDYQLNCTLDVIDPFSASTFSSRLIVVNPTDVQQPFSSLIASNNFSLISVCTSILNEVNCTGMNSCHTLNRQDCSTRDFSCGECLSGFVGEAGNHNSLCLPLGILSVPKLNSENQSCFLDNECDSFQLCNTTSKLCVTPLKQCPNNCSSRGVCQFYNTNLGTAITSCDITKSNCAAKCKCFAGFAGESCFLNQSMLQMKISNRELLVKKVFNLTQNISEKSIKFLTTSICAAALKIDELSNASIILMLGSALNVLSFAKQNKFKYEDISCLISSIDNMASIAFISDYSSMLLPIISIFGSLVASQMVAGQDYVDMVLTNYRLRAAVLVAGVNLTSAITLPCSPLEAAVGKLSPASVSLRGYVPVDKQIWIIESAARLHQYSFQQQYLSNSISIGLPSADSSAAKLISSVKFILPEVEALTDSIRLNFSTVCRKEDQLHFENFTCPFSRKIVVHNCTNKVGTILSTCSAFQRVCKILSQNNDIYECKFVNHEHNQTFCSCNVKENSTLIVRKRKLTSSNLESDSTILQIAALAELLGDDARQTFIETSAFQSSDAYRQALFVILMFSGLWSGGLVVFLTLRRWSNVKKKRIRSSEVVSRNDSHTNIKATVIKYMNEVFPSVFRTESRYSQIIQEVKKHHKYISLFRLDGFNESFLVLGQILTIQTMLMFLLALLYDVQSPSDDNSCKNWLIEDECLARKSVFDSSQFYCKWSMIYDDNSFPCNYRTPETSLQEALVIAVFVSIVTALFLRPTEYLFELLSAPTADSVKVKAAYVRTGKRMSNAARRMSIVAGSAMQTTVQSLAGSIHNTQVVGMSSRILPATTSSAQNLARLSMTSVASKNALKVAAIKQNERIIPYRNRQEQLDDHHDEKRKKLQEGMKHVTPAKKSAHTIFERLCKDINRQREVLRSSELRVFDAQWCLDDCGNFLMNRVDNLFSFQREENVAKKIRFELESVRRESQKRIKSFQFATDTDIGLELLHLFVLDLLGRKTPSARIFVSKAEEDFKRTKVVTKGAKWAAIAALVGLNIFYSYYSILYGFSQGVAWQQEYLVACLVQMGL